MGNCGSSKCCSSKPQQLKYVTRSARVIRQIIEDTLNPDQFVWLSDDQYACYDLSELRTFLRKNLVNNDKYIKETFDCDDFAWVLAGDQRLWIRDRVPPGVATTFGMVQGDIRKSESDHTYRPHAVNYFIDTVGELWLIEPQTDAIFKPTTNSTFWMTIA